MKPNLSLYSAMLISVAVPFANAHETECAVAPIKQQIDEWHITPSLNVGMASSSLEFKDVKAEADYMLYGLSLTFAGPSAFFRLDANFGSDSYDGSDGMSVWRQMPADAIAYFNSSKFPSGEVSSDFVADEFSHYEFALTVGTDITDNIDIFAGYRLGGNEYGTGAHLDVFDNTGPFVGANYTYSFNESSFFNTSLSIAFMDATLDRVPYEQIDGTTTGFTFSVGYTYLFTDSFGVALKYKMENFEYDIDDERFSVAAYNDTPQAYRQYLDLIDPQGNLKETNSSLVASFFYQF